MASPEQVKYPIKCHACVPTRDFGNGAKTLMRPFTRGTSAQWPVDCSRGRNYRLSSALRVLGRNVNDFLQCGKFKPLHRKGNNLNEALQMRLRKADAGNYY